MKIKVNQSTSADFSREIKAPGWKFTEEIKELWAENKDLWTQYTALWQENARLIELIHRTGIRVALYALGLAIAITLGICQMKYYINLELDNIWTWVNQHEDREEYQNSVIRDHMSDILDLYDKVEGE